jgi:hypothetical protein
MAAAAAGASSACTNSTINFTGPSAGRCAVSVAISAPLIEPGGGTGAVAVTAERDCDWSASVDVNWITFTSSPNGQGSGGVDFLVAPNSGVAPRRGSISVNGQRVSVDQAEPSRPCGFALDPLSQSVPAQGASGQFKVTADAGCAWTAISTASWIRITGNATGTGNGAVSFDVTSNGSGARTGTVQVAGQTFTVNQASAGQPVTCTFSVTPLTVTVQSTSITGTVSISSGPGCGWTASSNVTWLAIMSGTSGSGNGSVTFAAAANGGPQRVGTLTIADQTVTVTQSGTVAVACSFTLDPISNPSVTQGGGSFTVGVTASNNTCAWTATAAAVGWIRITSATSGTGSATLSYVIDINTGAQRSATMNIAGQDFTVTQASATCAYSITPASQSFPKAGGTGGPVTVTTGAGCSWTATSNESWIRNVSPSSGTGSGSVTFTVDSKPGNNFRTGTITIAGQTFTVDQN